MRSLRISVQAIRRILSVFICIGLIGAVWLFLKEKLEALRPPAPVHAALGQTGRPGITGLALTTYTRKDRKKLSIKADKIETRRRKLGHLVISPLREAILENVLIESYRYRNEQEEQDNGTVNDDAALSLLPFGDTLKKILTSELEGVSRATIHRIKIINYRDESQFLVLVADEATMSPTVHEVAFKGHFVLTTLAGETLEAQEAHWEAGRQIFKVQGTYRLKTGTGDIRGRRTAFSVDLDGRITQYEFQKES